MTEVVSLKDAVKRRGPYAVWDLLTEDERRAAAAALWDNADRDSRAPVELVLAKELKFRPHSVARLSTDRVAGRLVRLAEEVPENVLFQFLFHLHMAERRELLSAFLDAVGLPHDNGVLDLPEDFEAPDEAAVGRAAAQLLADRGHAALVYLATLKVADAELWRGVDSVLEAHAEDGTPLAEE
jgi:hypothetical protein